MPITAAGSPSCRPICSEDRADSSTRATSLMRTNEPSGLARTTTLPNSVDAGEATLGLDRQLELLVGQGRLGADTADRRLHVLRLERIDDVAGGQAESSSCDRVLSQIRML